METPNQFLSKKIEEVKQLMNFKTPKNNLLTKGMSLGSVGLPFAARQGIKLAHQLAKTAGTENQSVMSQLAIRGKAPEYKTMFNNER